MPRKPINGRAASGFRPGDCAAQSTAEPGRTTQWESRYHRRTREGTSIVNIRKEGEMQVLFVAACAIVAIWLIVLWGSRYLGPQ
jgi:hypothetical protein